MLRIIAVLIALLPAVALADMTGQASVIDGDTIEIHGQRIRLHRHRRARERAALPYRRQAVAVREECGECPG